MLSNYFVSEADIRITDELIMPDEPAPEHVDQEEEQNRVLQETSEDDKPDIDKHVEQDKKRRLFIGEEELEKGRVLFF